MTGSDLPSRTADALSRRGVLRGAAVTGLGLPLLAACGQEAATPAPEGSSSAAASGSPSGSPSGSGGAASPGGSGNAALITAGDVPVDGGTILPDEKIVVTQPVKGDFKAFTAVCTHQGCVVSSVADGTINCGCHGSRFSAADGTNTMGPNGSEAGSVADLEAVEISVEGDAINLV